MARRGAFVALLSLSVVLLLPAVYARQISLVTDDASFALSLTPLGATTELIAARNNTEVRSTLASNDDSDQARLSMYYRAADDTYGTELQTLGQLSSAMYDSVSPLNTAGANYTLLCDDGDVPMWDAEARAQPSSLSALGDEWATRGRWVCAAQSSLSSLDSTFEQLVAASSMLPASPDVVAMLANTNYTLQSSDWSLFETLDLSQACVDDDLASSHERTDGSQLPFPNCTVDRDMLLALSCAADDETAQGAAGNSAVCATLTRAANTDTSMSGDFDKNVLNVAQCTTLGNAIDYSGCVQGGDDQARDLAASLECEAGDVAVYDSANGNFTCQDDADVLADGTTSGTPCGAGTTPRFNALSSTWDCVSVYPSASAGLAGRGITGVFGGAVLQYSPLTSQAIESGYDFQLGTAVKAPISPYLVGHAGQVYVVTASLNETLGASDSLTIAVKRSGVVVCTSSIYSASAGKRIVYKCDGRPGVSPGDALSVELTYQKSSITQNGVTLGLFFTTVDYVNPDVGK